MMCCELINNIELISLTDEYAIIDYRLEENSIYFNDVICDIETANDIPEKPSGKKDWDLYELEIASIGIIGFLHENIMTVIVRLKEEAPKFTETLNTRLKTFTDNGLNIYALNWHFEQNIINRTLNTTLSIDDVRRLPNGNIIANSKEQLFNFLKEHLKNSDFELPEIFDVFNGDGGLCIELHKKIFLMENISPLLRLNTLYPAINHNTNCLLKEFFIKQNIACFENRKHKPTNFGGNYIWLTDI